MKSKKSSKPTKKDKDWQKKVSEKTQAEKIALDRPKGKERFDQVIKRMSKNKNKS